METQNKKAVWLVLLAVIVFIGFIAVLINVRQGATKRILIGRVHEVRECIA